METRASLQGGGGCGNSRPPPITRHSMASLERPLPSNNAGEDAHSWETPFPASPLRIPTPVTAGALLTHSPYIAVYIQ